MTRWRDASGQAASEYVALIALVAVALILAAGLTSGGVGARVLAGLQRGICRVAGASCPHPEPAQADLAPCPLERSERSEELSETIAWLRLGARGTLSAARGSDGHVTVTLADGDQAGGAVGVGAHVAVGGRSLGETVRSGLAATWSSGRSWTFPSEIAAQAFVARYGAKATIGGRLVDAVRSRCSLLCDAIGWRPHPQLPPPDERFEAGGATASLAASVGLGPLSATAGDEATAVLGRRIGRDGASAWYLQLDGSTTVALGLPAGVLAGVAGGEAIVSYELDARGRPVTLGVHLAGRLGGTGHLRVVTVRGMGAADEATAGGEVAAGAEQGTLAELDATLDLREPANRSAAAALLATLRHPDADLPRSAALLGVQIAHRAQLDLRTYAVRASGNAFGATVDAGLELGGAFGRTTRGLRLLSAETRLPGLPFLPRDDCRPA